MACNVQHTRNSWKNEEEAEAEAVGAQGGRVIATAYRNNDIFSFSFFGISFTRSRVFFLYFFSRSVPMQWRAEHIS